MTHNNGGYYPPGSFEHELGCLLNKHGKESGSNTPDYILRDHLLACLRAYEVTVSRRDCWYTPPPSEPQAKQPSTPYRDTITAFEDRDAALKSL